MRHFQLVLVLFWCLSIQSSYELQASQTQVLLQLRRYLEYPTSLEVWGNYYGDFCNISPSAHMSIKCEDNSVTELKIMGDKPVKVKEFIGLPIPNQTLSESFSIDSFVTTLVRLTSLRVLSLVSLGIWGPLPDKIHRLTLLEILDLSSNFLYGTIPSKISRMVKLHTLTINANYFNSTMPDWFDSLYNLQALSLNSNHLKGSFPSSLCKIKMLTDISLSHNDLSGKLPDLSALTGLHVLNLGDNHLESELPLMPKSVVTVLLSKNSFSGMIPKQFGGLNQLQHLDLSSNHLTGIPPSPLFSLPNIRFMNLASNVLSGSFSNKLTCGSKLGYVDISGNKLFGELPKCLESTSERRLVKYEGNCLTVDSHESQHQKRGTYCKQPSRKKFQAVKIVVAVAIIAGLVLILVLFGLGVSFCHKRCHLRKKHGQHALPKTVRDNSVAGVSSELLASASKYVG